jgi:phenylpyruvate tautomerase PptA (4-oxalocrotonate tautomerase family)
MPQVIIHVSNKMEEGPRTALVREVREAITTVLQLGTIIGQVILYETPVKYRGAHSERNPHFVFVEVFMYPGRDPAVKKELMQRILYLVNRHSGVDDQSILAVIHEIPRENYYGGMMKQH